MHTNQMDVRVELLEHRQLSQEHSFTDESEVDSDEEVNILLIIP